MSVSPAKPVIGILGGIGAGKSTVAAALQRWGCRVIDADALGHQMLDSPPLRDRIVAAWGRGVLTDDGRVDRQTIARKVFGDPAALGVLNAIMHPPMRRRLQEMVHEAADDESAPAVVLDAAVMVEAGWDDLCTALIFVGAPPQARAQRTAADRGWDPATWQRREDSQISLDRKRSMCQYDVYNCSDVADLEQQVREVFKRITHAKGPS